jgi:hypothetical protein
MGSLPRLGLGALATLAVLIAAGSVMVLWLVGQDCEWGQDEARGQALTRRQQAVTRSLEAKERVVEAVVAGRLTLPQAAERFRQLHKQLDEKDQMVGRDPRLEEEAFCRNVIRWVAAHLSKKRPEDVDRVTAALEAELRRYLQGRGRSDLAEGAGPG